MKYNVKNIQRTDKFHKIQRTTTLFYNHITIYLQEKMYKINYIHDLKYESLFIIYIENLIEPE